MTVWRASCSISSCRNLGYSGLTSEDVEVVANGTHGVSFDSLVGQVEVSGHGHPLEGLAVEVLPDGLVTGADVVAGGGGVLPLGATLLVLFVVLALGDDDVVEAFVGVGCGWVLVVDQELLLELEVELVLLVGLDGHIGDAASFKGYSSSRLARLFRMRIMGISLTQLSQEPTNFKP